MISLRKGMDDHHSLFLSQNLEFQTPDFAVSFA